MPRRAVIEIATEVLPDVIGVLGDAGLKIEASLDGSPGAIVLGVSGDILPEECAEEGVLVKQVAIELTQEAYGRQRMTRVSAIRVVPRTVGLRDFGIDADPRRRAA
jgi:hypothetical protein